MSYHPKGKGKEGKRLESWLYHIITQQSQTAIQIGIGSYGPEKLLRKHLLSYALNKIIRKLWQFAIIFLEAICNTSQKNHMTISPLIIHI